MNINTGEVEMVTPDEDLKRSDLVDISNFTEEQREEIQKIWSS